MINYIEKGAGLHEAIRRANHSLREVNGVFVSDDDEAVQAIIDAYSLDDAKRLKTGEITRHAKMLRDRAIATISAGEMASWPIKLAQMQAFSVTGDPADAPMLVAEATARQISLEDLCAKVSNKAVEFAGLEAVIAGVDGMHRDAVSALGDFDAVNAYDFSGGWPAV